MMTALLALMALQGSMGADFDPHWLRTLAPTAQVSQSRSLAASSDTSIAEASQAILVEGLLRSNDAGAAFREASAFESRYPGSPLVHRVRLLKNWALLAQGEQGRSVEGLAELIGSSSDKVVAIEARTCLRDLLRSNRLDLAATARLGAILPETDSLQKAMHSFKTPEQKPVFLVFPKSGEFGELGRRALQGAQLELNRLGQPYVVLEETPDPAFTWKMVRAAVELVRPKAIIGPLMSASAAVVSAGLSNLAPEVPLILPTATSPGISGLSPHAWQLNFTTYSQGEAMARYAWNCLDLREAAILAPQGDYGEGVAEGFRKAFTARGGRIFWQQAYPNGRTDFRAQLESLKRTWQQGKRSESIKPVVFAPVETSKDAIAIMQQTVGWTPSWLGASGWHTQSFLKEANGKFEGAYLVTDYAPDERRQEWKSFSQSYKAQFKEIPDRVAALGYDAVRLALSAQGLKSDTPYSGAQGEIRFDGTGRHNSAVPFLKISKSTFLVQSGDCTRKP
jgi:ABC-type branched-subunit amino acid transport system substrate-binding protein